MANVEAAHAQVLFQDADEARLAALGKKQLMKRHFNIWSLLFMAFCTSVTWEALCSTMAQALLAGGSSSMVWGFLATAVGSLLVALSLAEYASIIPTAGGQYHYVAELAPLKYRRILSWFAGYVTMWGWLTSTASGTFATAMQVSAYIILFQEGYTYQRWHTSLIAIAIITWCAVVGAYGIKILPRLTFFGIACHVGGYIASMVYLLVKTKHKNSATYVFTDLTNLSGWKSDGVGWSIGLLSSALGFVGWDSSTHMAEEMKDAARDLPRTMWGCVLVTGILTFPFVIVLMFCIDINTVLTGPVGTVAPLVQIFYTASDGSSAATIGMTSFFLLLSLLVAGPMSLTACSRIVWSFAREGGLPKILAKIDDKQVVPINALIFCWFVDCALCCLYIGNSTAFYGLASGVTVILVFSYAFPIAIHTIWGLTANNLKPGPFTLGRWSRPINIGALAWCTYIIIFLCFPTVVPVTPANMNYGSLVFGFVFILAGVNWFIYGKRKYLGVVHEVDPELERMADQIIHDHQHLSLKDTVSVHTEYAQPSSEGTLKRR